jgi:hypothetical protein
MDAPKSEKLNFDDISFEDVVGDGLELSTEEKGTEEVLENITTDEKPVESTESELELDADAEAKESDTLKEDKVELETKVDSKTQEEVVEEETEKSDTKKDSTVIGEVLSSLGFEGEFEYEDTADGLTEMTKDVANKLAEEQLDMIMERFPLVKQHLQYVMTGGDSQNFMQVHDPNQDYSKIALSEDDVSMQKVLVSNYFKSKGHDNEFIQEIIEDYNDSGKLFNKAELAKESLSKAQTQNRATLIKEQEKNFKSQKQQEKKLWEDIYTTIQDSKEFNGITIPGREKNKFFQYISAPVDKEGRTQSTIDAQNTDMKTRLFMDYLLFNKFDINKIINSKVKTSKAADLKSRIKTHTKSVKNATKATKRQTDFNIDDLDLSFGM